MRYWLQCRDCGADFSSKHQTQRCGRCEGMLEVIYEGRFSYPKNPKRFWDFAAILPDCKFHAKNRAFTPILDLDGIKLKNETVWFTGSFKDRGTLIEISKAKEYHYNELVCASTGNMAFSLSYFGKLSGIAVKVFISKWANRNKIKSIRGTHGADVTLVDGDYTAATLLAERYSVKKGAFLAGDYCYRKEGQSTVGFELMHQLPGAEEVIMPVGNATLFAGVYKAYKRARKAGARPSLSMAQADGAAPIVESLKRRMVVKKMTPHTKADGIAVGYPTYWEDALVALNKTEGVAVPVSDREMALQQKRLKKELGLTVEMAGAASLAAFSKIKPKGVCVAVISGGNV